MTDATSGAGSSGSSLNPNIDTQDVNQQMADGVTSNNADLSAYDGQSIDDLMTTATQTQTYMLSQQIKLQVMNAEMSMMAKEAQAIKVPQ